MSLLSVHGGFQTFNSRTYDLLYEISKLCLYTHGDQRNGRAKEGRVFLEKLRINNKIAFLFINLSSISLQVR